MATKKSTGRRAPKAKPDAAAAVLARYAHLRAPSPAPANNSTPLDWALITKGMTPETIQRLSREFTPPPGPSAEPAPLPNHNNLLNALLHVKGSLRLARSAVYSNAAANLALADADGVLTLADRELARIYAIMDSAAVRDLWETRPSSEGSDDE